MSRIQSIRFREIVRPLKTTFSTSLGRKQHIDNVIVKVTLEDGTTGAGEVPTSFAFAHETVAVIKETLTQAAMRLKGKDIGDYGEHVADMRKRFPHALMTVSGLEVALFRASLVSRGLSEHMHWGGASRRITTDITVPFLTDAGLLGRWLSFAIKKGFTTYKLKVSGKTEQDRYVLSFIYEYLKDRLPAFRVRLDGNQGFTSESCLAFLDWADAMRYTIELFEQPLPMDDFRGIAAVTQRSAIPIILDESVLTVADAQRAADNGAGHGFNIKTAKSGIGASAAIMQLAGRHSMKLMIGCMVETMCGLSAAICMAAGTGAFDFIDLDSVYFLYGSNRFPGIDIAGPNFLLQ